jgi:acyl-CoA synthetase (NDP forming)
VVQRYLDHSPPEGVWLSAEDTLAVLNAFGIPLANWEIADSPDAAVAAASRLGGLVAMKAIVPCLIHKGQAGGVILTLRGEEAVREAYTQLADRFAPSRRVLVQQHLSGGHEVLIGVTRDPAFGHLIAFGTGGTSAEAVRDVAFRLHPLTDRDALELMRDTRTIRSWEHQGKTDLKPLKTVLLQVSALLDAVPEIIELDLNPVKVFLGREVIVVDMRVRVAP